ncbi:MAG TPA: DUF4388 domain-containing protein [Chloroflexia bacterium]|nr:DUF4388 domain-containing protein [Chloroflexia bacterium]
MSLQGNLSELPIINLVQVLSLQKKTGILSVSYQLAQTQVCFKEARIFSAFMHYSTPTGHKRTLEGEEALFELLSWTVGQFIFEICEDLPPFQNVNTSIDQLILEHCRRQDEQEHLRQRERFNSIPTLAFNPPAEAQINLSLEEWRSLLLIDGKASIREIAAKNRQEVERIFCLVQGLEKRGLVELKAAPMAAVALG